MGTIYKLNRPPASHGESWYQIGRAQHQQVVATHWCVASESQAATTQRQAQGTDCTQEQYKWRCGRYVIYVELMQRESRMPSEGKKIISLTTMKTTMRFFLVAASLFDLSNSNHHDHLPYVWYP